MQQITPALGFWSIVALNGVIWLRSGAEKLQEGTFATNLNKTLTFFANGNPNSPAQAAGNPYPWYKWLLNQVAIPNSQLIGQSMQWGELLVGALIITLVFGYAFFAHLRLPIAALLIIPLLAGLIMNTLFWFAAGWTSPSTDTVNLLMIGIQIISVITLIGHCFALKSQV